MIHRARWARSFAVGLGHPVGQLDHFLQKLRNNPGLACRGRIGAVEGRDEPSGVGCECHNEDRKTQEDVDGLGAALYGLPSPDGRHLAIVATGRSNNIWLMENFWPLVPFPAPQVNSFSTAR